MSRVVVVPHRPQWANMFACEVVHLARALGSNAVAIHHIGSTAIPSIFAKPVIDILIEATSLDTVDLRNDAMRALGYEVMGELGIPGRRYFRKDNTDGERTHNVHTFEAGTQNVLRHLAFRDFMRAHPDRAREYSELKRTLAAAHPGSLQQYMDGKDAFIKQMERRAVRWLATSS